MHEAQMVSNTKCNAKLKLTATWHLKHVTTASYSTLKCKKLARSYCTHGIDHFIILARIHMKHGFTRNELTTWQHDVNRKTATLTRHV